AYLRKRGLGESEAGDVVQDILVKVLSGIQTYDRARSKFRTWLFGLAHNTLVDHARRRAAYQRALDGWVVHVLRATPSDSLKMAQNGARLHREQILEPALRTVRPRTSAKAWACFEQRLLRNRPAAAIAAKLKIEPNAVYVHSSRVLRQVRDICDEF